MSFKRRFFLLLVPVLLSLLFIWFFNRLSIESSGFAIDWKMFWRATHNIQIDYADKWVFNPPWTLALLWPFTLWSLSLSWGWLSLFTFVSLALCLPRDNNLQKWTFNLALLTLSYPALRQFADGNLEILVITGVLVMCWAWEKESSWAMALVIILLSSKVQQSWLLVLVIGYWVIRSWSREKLVKSLVLLMAFVTPFLIWKGQPWLEALARFPLASPFNSSLQASLSRSGVADWAIWGSCLVVLLGTFWGLRKVATKPDSIRAGLLITAGMLVAPYSGNSVLTPLALGVIPLIHRRPMVGLLLAALYYLPYFFLSQIELRQTWEYTYWTAVLLLTWAALIWDQRHPKPV